MSNNNYTARETSFWNFLQKNKVEIPIIQRDYAQGRLGKESLRKNFLSDLKNALDSNKTLKLDFVYGSMERQKMNPLDGQQRITTLWLLHWYIALCAGKLCEVNNTLLNFSYETRISSREFCGNLCNPKYFENFNGNDIVSFITEQTWFYSAWKQDPTIQSMLRMLGGTKVTDKKGEDIIDGIEELFKGTENFEEYWSKLSSDKTPIIFYHLPLQDFGLSDDLYVKMNARGKQLTSFENFKADLVSYITKQSEHLEEEQKDNWKILLNETDGIPIKMDTTWTDIFWKNRSTDSDIDEIYFAFMNRFFWENLFMYKNGNNYVLDIGKGDENSTQENKNPSYKYLNNSDAGQSVYDTTIAYKELKVYKFFNDEIPYCVFENLQKILNRYTDIPVCVWNLNFKFIPEFEKDNSGNHIEIIDENGDCIHKVTYLNQVQRVVFHAVCKYFIDGIADEDSLKQWMRVIWNLVSGEDGQRPQIRSTSAMRTAMEFIDELDSHNVYDSLNKYTIGNLSDSEFDKRCKEEIAKVKQILDEKGNIRKYNGSCKKEDGSSYQTWEEIIVEAEKYTFFKGSIRFLFTDTNGNCNWTDFDTKWENIKSLIPVEFEKRKTIRLMIPYLNDTDLKKIFSKITFSNKDYNLKKLLLDFPHKVDTFLLQKKQYQQDKTLLQKDLVDLCTRYPDYWIHCSWQYNFDILSNYQYRSGFYDSESYIVGSDFMKKRLELLHKISDISIKGKTSNESPWKGLFIEFKYKECIFRWQLNDWVDMYDNQWRNLWRKGLHTHYNGSEENFFCDKDSLMKELDRCVEYYKNKSNLSELSEK